MRFPAKKNAGCPKAPRDFPPRKDGILYPSRVDLGLPSPSHRVWADGRTDGRSRDYYVTTKFLGLIGYQISLAMELRWRALPAGSDNIRHCLSSLNHANRPSGQSRDSFGGKKSGFKPYPSRESLLYWHGNKR